MGNQSIAQTQSSKLKKAKAFAGKNDYERQTSGPKHVPQLAKERTRDAVLTIIIRRSARNALAHNSESVASTLDTERPISPSQPIFFKIFKKFGTGIALRVIHPIDAKHLQLPSPMLLAVGDPVVDRRQNLVLQGKFHTSCSFFDLLRPFCPDQSHGNTGLSKRPCQD